MLIAREVFESAPSRNRTCSLWIRRARKTKTEALDIRADFPQRSDIRLIYEFDMIHSVSCIAVFSIPFYHKFITVASAARQRSLVMMEVQPEEDSDSLGMNTGKGL